jgi:serine/threonine protein kinase
VPSTARVALSLRGTQQIGQGGMGVVYMARDSRLGRTGALKVLPAENSADSKRSQRFLREARAAPVHGESLQSILERGHLAFRTFFPNAHQIACAVAEAHAAGVVHRTSPRQRGRN